MQSLFLSFTICSFAQQRGFNGLEMNLGNLSRLSDAKTRSISPENFTGEKSKGGMDDTRPNQANAKNEASDLGRG